MSDINNVNTSPNDNKQSNEEIPKKENAEETPMENSEGRREHLVHTDSGYRSQGASEENSETASVDEPKSETSETSKSSSVEEDPSKNSKTSESAEEAANKTDETGTKKSEEGADKSEEGATNQAEGGATNQAEGGASNQVEERASNQSEECSPKSDESGTDGASRNQDIPAKTPDPSPSSSDTEYEPKVEEPQLGEGPVGEYGRTPKLPVSTPEREAANNPSGDGDLRSRKGAEIVTPPGNVDQERGRDSDDSDRPATQEELAEAARDATTDVRSMHRTEAGITILGVFAIIFSILIYFLFKKPDEPAPDSGDTGNYSVPKP